MKYIVNPGKCVFMPGKIKPSPALSEIDLPDAVAKRLLAKGVVSEKITASKAVEKAPAEVKAVDAFKRNPPAAPKKDAGAVVSSADAAVQILTRP